VPTHRGIVAQVPTAFGKMQPFAVNMQGTAYCPSRLPGDWIHV
jgi:hypothetical protein